MTSGPSRHNQRPPKRALRPGWSDTFSRYAAIGLIFGIVVGIWASSVHKVIEDEGTILLAVAGAAVALEAVILAAIALMAGFLSDFYGEVITTVAALDEFFEPFRAVAIASAATALTGFAGAIDNGSGAEWFRASLFGLTIGLMVWAIIGTVGLISVYIEHAEKWRKYENEKKAAFED
jgi:hypothetical protein